MAAGGAVEFTLLSMLNQRRRPRKGKTMINDTWSSSEKKNARTLFDLALQREYKKLFNKINDLKVVKPEDVWDLHDMLTRKRKEMDGKYDYRYSQLIFVFARLFHEGYLSMNELETLGAQKYSAIKKMVDFGKDL